MGVNLRDIVRHEPIEFVDLKGKIIAIDALNSLYQFLASIRQSDGTPLSDSNGRITSHLSGLLYRTVRLVNMGIKPIYVFDGEPPELKKQEIQRRKEIKRDAKFAWEKAKREGRLDDAKKFASRTSRFTDEMLTDSKKLLEYMGVPHIQAPSEGEAQCVHICNQGDAWAVGSQDYDTILLGTPRLVRGLTLSGNLVLEMIHTGNVLESLGLTREQLIDQIIEDQSKGIKTYTLDKQLRLKDKVPEDKAKEYYAQLGRYIKSKVSETL